MPKKKKVNAIQKSKDRYSWLDNYERKTLLTGGYFDSEGALHDSGGCVRCTSMVKSIGSRCKNFAIPGEVHCHIHGGTKARAVAGKRRIYSAFIQDKRLKQVMEKIEGSEEFKGLAEELSLLRGLLAVQVEKRAKSFEMDDIKEVARIITEIRNLVESCMKMEVNLGKLVSIEQIKTIVDTLVKILRENIRDVNLLNRIAHEFDNRILWPAAFASTPQPETAVSV